MEIIDIVNKLVGNTRPSGESHLDGDRYNNLQELTILCDEILSQIKDISISHNRNESSMKVMGTHAKEYLEGLRDWLNEMEF